MALVDDETRFTHAAGVAEAPSRFLARGLGGETEAAQLLLAHGEVERQLVVDLALERALPEREPQQPPPAGADAHAGSAVVRRRAAVIASTCRCQTGAW